MSWGRGNVLWTEQQLQDGRRPEPRERVGTEQEADEEWWQRERKRSRKDSPNLHRDSFPSQTEVKQFFFK